MASKNILFIESVNISPHIETSMELAENESNKGNKVFYYFIGHGLTLPPDWGISIKRNWWNSYFLPENRAERLVKLTYYKNIKRLKSISLSQNIVDKINNSANIHDLKNIKFGDIQVGQSVFGDYLNIRKRYTIIDQLDKELIKQLVLNVCQTLTLFVKVVKKHKIDKVYLFNGRFTFTYPILQYITKNGIDFLIHERGSSKNKYFLENYTPHDIKEIANKIINVKLDKKIVIEEAHSFFKNKRIGLEKSWFSFKTDTNLNLYKLPEDNERLIVFFTSSEFEFEAVSDQNPRNSNFNTQFEAIRILYELSIILQFRLVIRIHPNMTNSLELLEDLKLIEKQKNVIIYWPNDQVNSYDLLDISKIVVTYGSTIGAEAMYWGKPCILLQRAYYEKVRGLFIPNDIADLQFIIEGLFNGNVQFERNENDLLAFAYYSSNFGVEFKYYLPSQNGFHKGLFHGKNLQKSWLYQKIIILFNFFK
jgi:hypothetical protein